MELKCILRGRMVQVKPDELKRGDLFGMDYAIKEILHYGLYQQGREVGDVPLIVEH